MTPAAGSRYVGHQFCDPCGEAMREPCWLIATGQKVCASHHVRLTGERPPRPLNADDLGPAPAPPPAETAWHRVVPGLRARRSDVVQHGVELQGVKQVMLDGREQTVGDTAVYSVPDAALVEVVLMASAYRDSDEPTKAMVRVQLLRVLHGQERP